MSRNSGSDVQVTAYSVNSSIRNINLEIELNNFCYGVQVTPVLSVCGGQDDATEGVDWVWSGTVTVHLW